MKVLRGDWSKSRNEVFSSSTYSVIFYIIALDTPLLANINAHAYKGHTPLALELHILSLQKTQLTRPVRMRRTSPPTPGKGRRAGVFWRGREGYFGGVERGASHVATPCALLTHALFRQRVGPPLGHDISSVSAKEHPFIFLTALE